MKKIFYLLFLLMISGTARATIISDTLSLEPFSPLTIYTLDFDLGTSLSNITQVEFIVDPCYLSCGDTLGTGEPVSLSIADLDLSIPITLPLGGAYSLSLSLTSALLSDLADGLISADVSTLLTGATSSDFTLRVTADPFASAVPEPSILILMGVGLAGLGFARRRKHQA